MLQLFELTFTLLGRETKTTIFCHAFRCVDGWLITSHSDEFERTHLITGPITVNTIVYVD